MGNKLFRICNTGKVLKFSSKHSLRWEISELLLLLQPQTVRFLTSGEREKVIHLCSRIPRQANNKAFDTCNYPSIAKRCLMECAVDFLLMGIKNISSSLNGLRGSTKKKHKGNVSSLIEMETRKKMSFKLGSSSSCEHIQRKPNFPCRGNSPFSWRKWSKENKSEREKEAEAKLLKPRPFKNSYYFDWIWLLHLCARFHHRALLAVHVPIRNEINI